MKLTSNFNPIIHIYPVKKEYMPAGTIPSDPRRQFHQFAFFTEGIQELNCGEKHLVAKKNSFLYLPFGHSVDFFRNVPSECYHIAFQLLNDDIYEPFCIVFSNSTQILNIFKKMLHLQTIRNIENNYEIAGLLYELFSLVHANFMAKYYPPTRLAQIEHSAKYITTKYLTEDISISYLANMCHISTRYYSEIFCAHYGCSPQKYIAQLKVNHAKELLADNKLKISEVAEQSNFNDIYHFSKMFKKITGFSPREFRDMSTFNPF